MAKLSKFPRLRRTRLVFVPLVGATVFSLLLAGMIPDFGVNVVADVLSLWFGLFVLDVALERERREARKPVYQAMVHDLVRLRRPIVHILTLLLLETATDQDVPAMRAAVRGQGDVAAILARRHLIPTPAPMTLLGSFSGVQLTWWQVVTSVLSPANLHLDMLITRYLSVGEAPLIASLQELEVSPFMDFICGHLAFDDDLVLEIFWRSLIQSLDKIDKELESALAQQNGVGALLGPQTYINFVIDQRVAEANSGGPAVSADS